MVNQHDINLSFECHNYIIIFENQLNIVFLISTLRIPTKILEPKYQIKGRSKKVVYVRIIGVKYDKLRDY